MKRLFTLLGIFITCSSAVMAQLSKRLALSGNVYERSTGQPMPGVTVRVVSAGSNKMINQVQTSSSGVYNLQIVPGDSVILYFSAMGYGQDTMVVSSASPKQGLTLPAVYLKIAMTTLKSIEVNGRSPALQLELGKMVYNVGKDPFASGKPGTELVRNLPGITVGPDGSIFYRGQANLQLKIDDRLQRNLTVKDLLEQVSAEDIERIELSGAPSSRESAAGAGAILNVVLKKSVKLGLWGNAGLGVNSSNGGNANLNLNYRREKFQFYTRLSANRFNPSFEENSVWKGIMNDTSDMNIKTRRRILHTMPKATIGADYYIDSLNVLGISYSGQFHTDNIGTYFDTQYGVNNKGPRKDLRETQNKKIETEHTFNTNYHHDFTKSKHYLDLDLTYVVFNSDNTNEKNNLPSDRSVIDNSNLTATIDYVKEFNSKNKLEAGFNTALTTLTNDYNINQQSDNTSARDILKYKQQIHALYVQYSKQFGKITIRPGVRAEQTGVRAKYTVSDAAPVTFSYLNFFPSLGVFSSFGKGHSLSLNYSARIGRPDINDIYPFPVQPNPFDIKLGNPLLKPTLQHNTELSYLVNKDKWSVSGSVYLNYGKDIIQRITTLEGNKTISKTENYGESIASGGNGSAKVTITPFWETEYNLNANFVRFNRLPDSLSNPFTRSFNHDLVNRIKISKQWLLEVAGGYSPVSTGLQEQSNAVPPILRLNVLYKLKNEKGNLSLNIYDVFGSGRNNVTIKRMSNTIVTVSNRWNVPFVMLRFNYKFGRPKERKDGNRTKQPGSLFIKE